MKKKLATIIASTIILSPLAFNLPNDINPVSQNNHTAHAEGKVLSKYTLSKGEVKSMASSMPKNIKILISGQASYQNYLVNIAFL